MLPFAKPILFQPMESTEFTEEEQGRYDRQIRLWGVEAQQRCFGNSLHSLTDPISAFDQVVWNSALIDMIGCEMLRF